MKATIVTPTSEREGYLQLLYKVILAQRFEGQWEWLIYDSSLYPSKCFQKNKDARIRYFYDTENLTIGEKRNFLKSQAQGEIIFHFDDDDYYAPFYLQKVGTYLKEFDFFKLTSFYCYHAFSKQFFYYDTSFWGESHFILDPVTHHRVREIDYRQNWREKNTLLLKRTKEGYGFSYAYRRKVAETANFAPLNHAEEHLFFNKARRLKYNFLCRPDEEGFALHMLHASNSSSSHPQYRLPPFLGKKIFPEASTYLKKYPSDIIASTYAKNQTSV